MTRRALLLLAPLVAAGVFLLVRHGERAGRAGPHDGSRLAAASSAPPDRHASAGTPPVSWSLSVEVRDASGLPTSASILLANEAGDLVERVDAAAGEEVRFEVQGTATLRILGTGDVFAPSFIEGVTAPSGTEKRLSVRLDRGLSISGRVRKTDADAWPLENCAIYAEPLDAPWNAAHGRGWEEDSWGDGRWLVFAVGVRGDGTFTVAGLRPGRYRVAAECGQEYGPRDMARVVDAGAAALDIVLVRQACVQVRFLEGATHESSTAFLSWILERETGEQTHSGEGDATLPVDLWLPPGTRAMLRADAEGYVPRAPLPVVAGRSGERTDVVCELHPDPTVWADLEVALRDEGGQPVTDMVVRRGATSVSENEEGVYRLRVPAGTRYVEAEPSWHLVRDLRAFWLPVGIEVQLERGSRVRRELSVRRGALIVAQGDFGGEPRLPGTDYWFLPREKGGERSYVALVAPGTYRVEGGKGRARVGIEVEVREGQVTYATPGTR